MSYRQGGSSSPPSSRMCVLNVESSACRAPCAFWMIHRSVWCMYGVISYKDTCFPASALLMSCCVIFNKTLHLIFPQLPYKWMKITISFSLVLERSLRWCICFKICKNHFLNVIYIHIYPLGYRWVYECPWLAHTCICYSHEGRDYTSRTWLLWWTQTPLQLL